ncbi:MAG: BON domain-containing protein [Chloroflexi bacterium]|nr:BON domain-containing protein [Chloroflexota bacterium]
MENYSEYNPDYRPDDEIEEDLSQQLEADPRIDEVDIDVGVTEGIARLTGTAESGEEAEMAESIATRVDGVLGVINEVYVVSSSHTEARPPGLELEQEPELEDIEVLPGDREATENYIEAVDEGLSYIPPDEPEFPTERDSAGQLRRREVGDQRFKSRRKLRKHETDKVEGTEL